MKLWARIGITVDVTEEQYQALLKKAKYTLNNDTVERIGDCNLTEKEAAFFIKNGYLDGESYIPETVLQDIEWNKE